MAARHRSESSSSEEGEFLSNLDGITIEPYQYEPEYDEGELPSLEESDSDESGSDNDALEEDEGWRLGNDNWCECTMCGSMPTTNESHCCRELGILDEKRTGQDTEGCITTNPEFRAFTQRVVVENTLLLLHHVRNNPVDITKHSGLRWAAYRQWTAWVHGHLGWKVRHPIPACVVLYIRNLFPKDPEEEYVGFQEADDNE